MLTRIGILASALAAACRHGGAEEKGDVETPAVVGARTAVATRQPFTETIEAIGTVAPRPGKVAQLGAPGPTRVTHIFVTVGQHVAVGTPLVEFDRGSFDAQAQSAEVALTTANRAYDRAKRLVDAGILAKKDLDQASNDAAQARATSVAAQRAQSLATLRAPIAGVVTKLTAVLSAPADASQPVVEIADPSALDILMTVSASAAARVHAGESVALSAGQRPADSTQTAAESLGTATVADVGASVDSTSRGVLVRARMTHGTRPLRIGETVFGKITVGVRRSAVTVPVEALVPDGEGFKVFTLDSAKVAHATTVTVGARTERLAEITSGLSGGETVVTYGAYGVQDSAKVIPMTATESAAADAASDSGPSSKTPPAAGERKP